MWNLATSNKICSDHFTTLKQQQHLNNIYNVKKSINNSAPEVPGFLRSRAKQEKMKEVRNGVIQYENRVLLDKMMEIEKKKTSLNPSVIIKSSFQPKRTLNVGKRIKDLKKINDENKAMLRRLQGASSVYNIDKWIDDDRKHHEVKRNISQNARRTFHADFSDRATSSVGTRTFYSHNPAMSNGFNMDSGAMHYEL